VDTTIQASDKNKKQMHVSIHYDQNASLTNATQKPFTKYAYGSNYQPHKRFAKFQLSLLDNSNGELYGWQ
jgi:hypothetical protein